MISKELVKCFDGHGNFNLGLTEQLMFPELNYDSIDQVCGMDISIVTNSNKVEGAFIKSPWDAVQRRSCDLIYIISTSHGKRHN